MHPQPQVSILINNYNYGRYLGQAIASALAQDYRPVEVIVVDDGSTDESAQVIRSFGDRVVPVIKTNGGQASAFNAGFARSQGEIVFFLDADDALFPETAGRVAQAFRHRPEAAKAQFRLEIIDAAGQPTGEIKPSRQRPLPSGDLRQALLSAPDDIPWQPTSGNAFPAWVLRRILPAPEAVYRLCADYYLSNLAPLFGPVLALEEPGGSYRVHTANNHHSQAFDLEKTRQLITRTLHTHHYLRRFARSAGLEAPAGAVGDGSLTLLTHRLASLRLDPYRHPLPEDRAPALALMGMRAALRRPGRPLPARLLYALWFAGLLAAPKPALARLLPRFLKS